MSPTPSLTLGGWVRLEGVGLRVSSVPPQLRDLEPTSTPFCSWGNQDSTGCTLPQLSKPPEALTSRLCCLLWAEHGSYGWALAQGWAWPAGAPLCWRQQGVGPKDPPRGLSHSAGVGWDSVGGHTAVSRGCPMRRALPATPCGSHRKPKSELGNVNITGTPPGIWCPRASPPNGDAPCYL